MRNPNTVEKGEGGAVDDGIFIEVSTFEDGAERKRVCVRRETTTAELLREIIGGEPAAHLDLDDFYVSIDLGYKWMEGFLGKG